MLLSGLQIIIVEKVYVNTNTANVYMYIPVSSANMKTVAIPFIAWGIPCMIGGNPEPVV